MKYTRLLRQGSRGNDVRILQYKLTGKGFNTFGIDGIFGPNTYLAVKKFQKHSNIGVDGIVGRQTVNALNSTDKYEVLRPNAQTTVVRIPHKNIKDIKTIMASNNIRAESLQSMKNRTKVDLIINGGLYFYSRVHKKNWSINLLFVDGKQIVAGQYSRFCLLVDKNGTYEFDWYKWDKNKQSMIGGSPSLIINNKIKIDKGVMEDSLINNRHPRSAIGMSTTHFYMVVIDGRNASRGLYGMTIRELANYMKSLGCHSAINLDGGGSSKIIGSSTLNKNRENRGIHNSIGIVLKQKG
ncbi:MAG TPA: phosphodiester glycosidase family protein [Tissierellaceae bacterium]|nr:phosphodiester glycosidase family protein [Tissierellaceae bacterium]